MWTIAALGWTVLVWALLTTPTPPHLPSGWMPPVIRPWSDKLAHAALFLVEAGLLERALDTARVPLRRFRFAAALGACLLLGAASELRQRAIATREASMGDFAADALGALLYGGLLAAARSRPGALNASGS